MRLETRDCQADEAGLNRPEAEAVAVEVIHDPRDHGIALGTVERFWEMLHHSRVGV
jgi:hypothetical protein